MSELIGRTLGPYRIVEQLGMGGMATVYKAYHAAMDRHVAVKVLPRHFAADPTFVGRFEQEAKVIARLENARILPVYDYGEEDGITYIVMRYLDAGTLSERIRAGQIPFAEIARIIAQVGDGLDYAHKKGVIHRDVKPSNIMLAQNGDVYITDFGISKLVEGTAQFTGSGIVGTPDYVSPEQALGQPIDYRSDIYSLGIVLYQMATGDVPFHAETPMAVIIKHINDPLPLPRTINPDIPEAVQNVILKALAKKPDERFQHCSELTAALNTAVDSGVSPDRATTEHGDTTAPLPSPQGTLGAGTTPMAVASAASAPTAMPHKTEPMVGDQPAKKKTSWLVPALIVVGLLVLLVGGFIVLRTIQRVREANQRPTPTSVVGVAEVPSTEQVGAAVAAPPAEQSTPGAPGSVADQGQPFFADDFSGAQLDPAWLRLNIDDQRMKLDNGVLVLPILPGTRLIDFENRRAMLESPALALPVPDQMKEYMLQVDVKAAPTQNYQAAGLIMLATGPGGQRQLPLFALIRGFCDTPERCHGDAIYFDSLFAFAADPDGYQAKIGGSVASGEIPANGVVSLRIVHEQSRVVGYYSVDKTTWHLVGDWPLPQDRVDMVGIVTTTGGQPTDLIPTAFDNFEAGPPPPPQ